MDNDELLRRPIAVYGTGRVAEDVLRLLTRAGAVVRWTIDHHAELPATVGGHDVQRPDSLTIPPADRAAATVVIAAFNPFADIAAIQDAVRQFGWGSSLTFIDLHHRFSKELGSRFWLSERALIATAHDRIVMARALWDDEASLVLFDAIMSFRRTGRYEVLPPPDVLTQYAPPELPLWQPPIRLIDGGAFDGDTVRSVMASCSFVDAIAAFEPDTRNLALACESAAELSARIGDFRGHSVGLWDRSERVSFDASGTAASHIGGDGTTSIECVSLDGLLPDFAPSVIKLDIEGAEIRALTGARQTIDRYRPALAVCVYHCPNDLWEIPLLLHDWDLGYKLYLRVHAHSTFDTVLYAIPSVNGP